MNFIKKHFLTISIFIGALFGYVFLHPFGILVHQVHIGGEGKYLHIHWDRALAEFKMAFSIEYLPPAILYVIFSGGVAYLIAKVILSYKKINEQLKIFSFIGENTSGFIHDLKNNIIAISQFADYLCENAKSSEQDECCDGIRRQSEKVLKLAADISVSARQGTNFPLDKQGINLRNFIENIVSGLTLGCKVEIRSEISEDVFIDVVYFERVLWNLIKNADEALTTIENGRIKISITQDSHSVIICVSDNGPGIPRKALRNIFKIGKTFGKTKGSGIGLYNCRIITEAHGGKIWAISEVDKGTNIYVKIPK